MKSKKSNDLKLIKIFYISKNSCTKKFVVRKKVNLKNENFPKNKIIFTFFFCLVGIVERTGLDWKNIVQEASTNEQSKRKIFCASAKILKTNTPKKICLGKIFRIFNKNFCYFQEKKKWWLIMTIKVGEEAVAAAEGIKISGNISHTFFVQISWKTRTAKGNNMDGK